MQGIQGPQGNEGPQGPAGLGVKVYDRNQAELGIVLDIATTQVTMVTSTGHIVSLRWDGTMAPSQIFWTNDNCQGSPYLNGLNANAPPIFGRYVFFSTAANALMVPSNVLPNNSAAVTQFQAATLENPGCIANAGVRSGFPLQNAAPAVVGLPRYPVFAPLLIR
ncbi:MAG: hypothetical protein H6703_16650 [Myxococcales bacterium]|nr:hypothetical protein [Myxococcales bacterium]